MKKIAWALLLLVALSVVAPVVLQPQGEAVGVNWNSSPNKKGAA